MIGRLRFIAILTFAFLATQTFASAQQVSAPRLTGQLSTKEAYVGQPILLQILIVNANTHTKPVVPEIDGLEIRSTGQPQQSTRTTIFNGVSNRTVTLMYVFQVTPRRGGNFTIPPIEVELNGKANVTKAFDFVVTKSDTGDLMFLEVTSEHDEVYVGQPIKLQMKLWIRPYRDKSQTIKLTEQHMWQLISDSTQWGPFDEKIVEMAGERRRLVGEEVLREDSEGNSRGYYLYEMEATLYPQRAGPLEIAPTQIVVSYPTAIDKPRRRRSIFGDDDIFGGSMFEDVFANSPFNRRSIAIKSVRPISADATVNAIDVLDVPSEGRPTNYRGAVGKYRIGVQAQPTKVTAGDPITLQIGLQGDGPMELIEAPPLAAEKVITDDFKVADDALAGYVQNDAKLFTTTIRPRSAGVSEIPPVPFSFFDPEKREFKTIYSEPIPIEVQEAETLSMDAIVGSTATDQSRAASVTQEQLINKPDEPTFSNYSVDEVLADTSRSVGKVPWFLFALPPLAFGVGYLYRYRDWIASLTSRTDELASSISQVRNATVASEIIQALGPFDSADVQRVINKCNAAAYGADATTSLDSLKSEALDVLRDQSQGDRQASQVNKANYVASLFLLTALFVFTPKQGRADDPVSLDREQVRIILGEATDAFSKAIQQRDDQAEAKASLEKAIERYELVALSGSRSPKLYTNLGNAYLMAGQPANAIARYEQALKLSPNQPLAKKNLRFARQQMNDAGLTLSQPNAWSTLYAANAQLPQRGVQWLALLAWLALWLLFTYRLFLPRTRFVMPAILCCLVLSALSGGSYWIAQSTSEFDAVSTEAIELHEGDDFRQPVTAKVEAGVRLSVLAERGGWIRVKSRDSKADEGWVSAANVYRLRS